MNQSEALYVLSQYEIKHQITFPSTIRWEVKKQQWVYKPTLTYGSLKELTIYAHPYKPRTNTGTKPKNRRRLAAYEKLHNGKFYGSQVTKTLDGWRCLSIDEATYHYASTIDELVYLYPFIFKPNYTAKPYHTPAKPITIRPRKHGTPTELQGYTYTKGFNLQKRHGMFHVLNEDKTQTLILTFEQLLTLPHLNLTPLPPTQTHYYIKHPTNSNGLIFTKTINPMPQSYAPILCPKLLRSDV